MRLSPSVLKALRGSVLGTTLWVGCGASQGPATTTVHETPTTGVGAASSNATVASTPQATPASTTQDEATRDEAATAEASNANASTVSDEHVAPPEEYIPPPCGRG